MATFPNDWPFRYKLAIQSGQVIGSGTHSNFSVLVVEDNLPQLFLDGDGNGPALNGGGDVRFSSDAAGTNRLPCEVVVCYIDNDHTQSKVEIWVKRDISTSVNTDIYIWWGVAGESQPAVTDPYGRNNTWDSNYKFVGHHAIDPTISIVDSKGNKICINAGLDSDDLVDSKVGKGYEFDNAADESYYMSDIDANGKLLTLEAWVKKKAASQPNTWGGIFHKYGGTPTAKHDWALVYGDTSSFGWRFWAQYDGDNLHEANTGAQDSSTDWRYLAGVCDNTYIKLYVNKSLQTNYSDVSARTAISDRNGDVEIGHYAHGATWTFDGDVDEVRISDINRSTGWLDTSYNNQDSPSTFITGSGLTEFIKVAATVLVLTVPSIAVEHAQRISVAVTVLTLTVPSITVDNAIYAAPSSPLVTTYNSDKAGTDGESNPNNLVTHKCKFSAVAEFSGADKYQIRVGITSGGAEHWTSDKVSFEEDPPGEDERCEKIQIATKAQCGAWLQAGVIYYWQIRFFDDAAGSSNWSAIESFNGVTPADWDDGTPELSGTNKRRMVEFGSSHSLMPNGSTVRAEIETGYGVRLVKDARVNEALQHSNRCSYYHKGFRYGAYLAQKTTDGFLVVRIIKYKYADGTVSTYDVKTTSTQADSHDAPSIIVGDDEKLHVIISGHNSQGYYFRTTNAHQSGTGIDITSWTSQAAPSALSACTYPRIRKDSKGNLFCFFRHSGVHKGHWCYMKSDDNGATWGSRKYIVYYSDYLTTSPSMYCGGVEIDNQDRCHLIATFWEGYLSTNISRAVTYVYADLDGSDEFTDWYELDNATKVGSITTTPGTDNIQFGDLTMGKGIVKLWDDDTSPYDGPYYHTNGDGLVIDEQNQLPVFCYFMYTTSNQLQVETPIFVAYWNSFSLEWEIRNLEDDTGKTLWVHRQGGQIVLDGNSVNVYGFVKPVKNRETIVEGISTDTDPDILETGTCDASTSANRLIDTDKSWTSGEWVTKYAVMTGHRPDSMGGGQIEQITASTSDRLYWNPAQMIPYASEQDYAVFEVNAATGKNTSTRIKDVKTQRDWNSNTHWGPNHFANRHFWIKAGDGLNRVRGITASDWYSVTLDIALDIATSNDTEYEIYKEATENLYSAGELYVWRGSLNNEPFTGEFLSLNTGKGCGMITTDGKSNSTSGREIIANRLNEIVLIKDLKHPDFRVDGNDIVIVKASIDGSGNYSFIELNRVPDAFGMKATNIFFAITGAIPLDTPCEEDQVYIIYSGDSDTTHVPAKDHTNVFKYVEGFERYIHGTYLDGQGGWSLQSGAVTSCRIIDTSGNQWGHTAKVWNGSLGAWFFAAAVLRQDFGSVRTDREISYAVHTEDIGHSGKVYINLVDESGNGFSFGLNVTGGNGYAAYKHHDGSWINTSVGVNGATWYMLTIKINSSGVSCYLNKGDDPADRITCLTNDNHITDFRYLEIGAEGPSFAAMVDFITIQHAFADDPETAAYAYPDVQGLSLIIDLSGQPASMIMKTVDPHVMFDVDIAIASTILNLNSPNISVEISPLQVDIIPAVFNLNVAETSVIKGAISPELAATVLNLNIPNISVYRGAISVDVNSAELNLNIPNLEIIRGAIIPDLSATILNINIPIVSVSKGAISADIAPVGLNVNVPNVSVEKSPLQVSITSTVLNLGVPNVDVVPGAISPAVSPTMIDLNAPGVDVSKGTITIDIATILLNFAIPNINIIRGAISPEVATNILALNIPIINVNKGGISPDLATAVLNLNVNDVVVTIGAVSANLNPATLNIGIPDISVTKGSISPAIAPTVLNLSVPGIDVFVDIEASIAAAVIGLNVPDVSILEGAVIVDITAAIININIPDIGVSLGGISCEVTPLVLNLNIPDVSIVSGLDVDIAPAILDLTGPGVTVDFGGITSETSTSIINLTIPDIGVSIGVLSATIAPMSLALNVPDISIDKTIQITIAPVVLTLNPPDVNVSKGEISSEILFTILSLDVPAIGVSQGINFVDIEPVSLSLIVPNISASKILEVDVAQVILNLNVPGIEVLAGSIIRDISPTSLNIGVPNISVLISGQSINITPSQLSLVVSDVAASLGVKAVSVDPSALQLEVPNVNVIIGLYIQIETTILNLAIPDVHAAVDIFVDVASATLNLIVPKISGGFKLEIININIESGLKFSDLIVSSGLFAKYVKLIHPMALPGKTVVPGMRFKNVDIEKSLGFKDMEVE